MKRANIHPTYRKTSLGYRLCGALVGCVVAFVLFFVGCTSDKESVSKIYQAEQLCLSAPHDAVEIMQSIDPMLLRGKHDKARYALVYSEALFYGDVDVKSDSLTRPMIDYYFASKHHNERARAFYQHAVILNRMGERAEAMLSIMTAEESIQHYDNPRLEGLICRLKGDIYASDCFFKDSFAAYEQSMKCFERAGLDEHRAFALYDMADAQDNQRNYEYAEQLYYEALEYAKVADNKMLLCGVLHGLCHVYSCTDRFDRCEEVLEMFVEYGCLLYYESFYYCLRAIVDSYAGNEAEALKNMELAEAADDAHILNLEYTRYVINHNIGNHEEALYWLEQNKSRQDSLILNVLRQPVLSVQVDLLQQGVEKEKRERMLVKQRNMILFFAFLTVVAAIFIYLRLRLVARERDVAMYMDTIKEIGSSTELLRNEVRDLYGERFKDLNRMCETYYEHGNTPREATKVFDEVKLTIESIKSDDNRIVMLERIVNLHHNNLMSRLRSECPKLNERELRVVLFSYAGFSTRAICIFMDTDLAALSRLKYKIKIKLNECGVSDAQAIISKI